MSQASAFPLPVTAALVIIGNEILSGKVQEANIQYLAQGVFSLGWHLKEIAVVPDEHQAVVDSVRRLSQAYHHVFTSGGVGPTHDDITLAAVAEATGKRLVLSPVLERLLQRLYGVEILSPSQQRLALVPDGSVLHYGTTCQYPQMVVDNVYPLPGIPDLFREKFDELKELWPPGIPRERRCLNLIASETDLAELLARVAAAHPEVQLGSYPTFQEGEWHLELVLESANLEQLDQALSILSETLGVKPAEA